LPNDNKYIPTRSSIFWDVMRRRLVVSYRRFATTYQPHLER